MSVKVLFPGTIYGKLTIDLCSVASSGQETGFPPVCRNQYAPGKMAEKKSVSQEEEIP